MVQQQHRGGVIGGDAGGITVEGKAIVVKAPSGDGAVRAEHQRVKETRSEGDDGLAREHAAPVNQHRDGFTGDDGAIGGGTVAELAKLVIAPGGEGAVRAKHHIVTSTRSDGDDGLAREHPALVYIHWGSGRGTEEVLIKRT